MEYRSVPLYKRRNKAFFLKDYLVALIIMLMMFPFIASSFGVISYFKNFDTNLRDMLAIENLKRRMTLIEDVIYDNNSIEFKRFDKVWNLNYKNNKLYLSPGYQLYLDNIDSLHFEIDHNSLYINYVKDNKNFRRAIAVL